MLKHPHGKVTKFSRNKEHLLSKYSTENIVHWRATKNPSNLSEINSDTSILLSIAIGV